MDDSPPHGAPGSPRATAQAGPRLRLLPAPNAPDDPSALERAVVFVRAVRRDMARLLRGMHASEQHLSALPQAVTTRLAHLDAVTARFLAAPEAAAVAHAEAAARDMRRTERWLVSRLSGRELAAVRAQELRIRVDDAELVRPLVCLDRPLAPGDEPPPESANDAGPRSLRRGLAALSDQALGAVCRRLGVRAHSGPAWRERAERAVEARLRDGHLLAVLLATLSPEAQRLLAAMLRGQIARGTWHTLLAESGLGALASGGALLAAAESPAASLQACALAFPEEPARGPGLWAPVELVHRLDGLLRSMGV